MTVINVTSENFQKEVMESTKPVLLDFWASWCMPCRMFAPTLHKFAEDNDNVVVGKVNIDEQAALAHKFEVMSIPTVVVVKDGKVTQSSVGMKSKKDLEKMLA